MDVSDDAVVSSSTGKVPGHKSVADSSSSSKGLRGIGSSDDGVKGDSGDHRRGKSPNSYSQNHRLAPADANPGLSNSSTSSSSKPNSSHQRASPSKPPPDAPVVVSASKQGQADDLLFSGLMMKRGGFRKNWKLRWFELTRTHLLYFRCVVGSAAELRGTIRLCDVQRVVRGKHAIETVTKTRVTWPELIYPPARKPKTSLAIVTKSRTYYAVAPERVDAKQWEKALNHVISTTNGTHQGGPGEEETFAYEAAVDDGFSPYSSDSRRMTISQTGITESISTAIQEQEEMIRREGGDVDGNS